MRGLRGDLEARGRLALPRFPARFGLPGLSRCLRDDDFTNDEWTFIDYGLSYSRHSLSAITISSTLVFLGGTDGFNYYNTIDFTSFSCPKGGFAYNGTCICLSGMYNNGSSCLICKAGISLIPQLHFFRLLFLKWCFVL